MFLLWKIISLVNLFSLVNCQFENQYLGHHITHDEYNKLEFTCDTPLCLQDAQLLLLAATQDKMIEPCEDFAEFAMGQFMKSAELNDPSAETGFKNDLQALDWERNRKVLAAKINESDIRPFKIAKNYYQQCLNSGKI